MNDKKKTIILMTSVVIIMAGIMAVKLFKEFPSATDEELQKGKLNLSQEVTEDFVDNPTDDLIDADDEYYQRRECHVTIIDPEDILSQSGFLPVKAHFVRNDEIAKYLNQSGYECEEVEITTEKGPLKKGNNSTFYCILPEYDQVFLKCTWYGMTEEFKFEIIKKETTAP